MGHPVASDIPNAPLVAYTKSPKGRLSISEELRAESEDERRKKSKKEIIVQGKYRDKNRRIWPQECDQKGK